MPRPYLAQSQIRASCSRALWYSFRWATQQPVRRAHAAPVRAWSARRAVFIAELRAIGTTVHEGRHRGNNSACSPAADIFAGTGRRSYRTAGSARHLACTGIQNAQRQKSFADLQKNGVAKSKPVHYAQMQVYMALTGMTRAMYLAVNKDNDELYSERVNADADEAKRLIEKSRANHFCRRKPPPGVSTKIGLVRMQDV